jgi:integrase/recombinase XerD
MTLNTLPPGLWADDPILELAIAAYLARYKGQSRMHTASDLNCHLAWCLQRDLMPMQAQRAHIELYVRWMQEIHRRSRRRSLVVSTAGTFLIEAETAPSPVVLPIGSAATAQDG